jgi:hypothetical protein
MRRIGADPDKALAFPVTGIHYALYRGGLGDREQV